MADMNVTEYKRALESDVLARTIWGEARGEGENGMRAVACVVMNRVAIGQGHKHYWWGKDVISVCQKPFQFSCWNKLDPNFRKVQSVDKLDMSFTNALRIAAQAVRGGIADVTGGATHYHIKTITPDWAKGKKPCATVGLHVFYRILE